jgi:hypothetical protein
MTVSTEVLGPGELQIGAVASEIDASCLVNNCKITMTKDQADSTKKLCGDEAPGAVTYTFALTGNVDQDLATTTGLHALSWNSAGTSQPFTFTPSTSVGATATGTLTIDPLEFGGDEMGADMTSDFEWSCVGKPAIVYGTGVVGDAQAVGDGEAA